ncbi:MAG: site-specific integrase [Actinomycetota bacterium]
MASIYKHQKGWRAAVVGPSGRRTTRLFKLKADAEAWARNLEADADRGAWTDPAAGRRTLGDYVDEWLESQRWRASTREQAESHLRSWILPAFGDKPIGSITNTQIRRFVKDLDEHLAPSTVEAIYRRLVSVLTAAVADRVIALNPATTTKIRLPADPPRDPARLVVLKPDHVVALADSVAPWLRAFVWCGAAAGLRPGETAGLSIEALDLSRRTITVDRQLSTTTGGPRLARPKTPASHRTIPIPDELVHELNLHIDTFNPVTVADEVGEGHRQLIFTNRDGRPLRRNTLSDSWHRGATRAGLPPEATGWHQLRHFYASLLIAAGESVKTVQARMGHATAAETLGTYAALWPTADDSTRSAVSSAFAADDRGSAGTARR